MKFILAAFIFTVSSNVWATDLHDAAGRGDLKTLKAQVKTKAQANSRNEAGESLLIAAAGMEDQAVLTFLLSKGADLNAKDNEGKTALFYAVAAGLEDNALLLIEKKADLKLTYGEKKESILFEAARMGLPKIIAALAKKDRSLVNAKNSDQETALFESVRAAQSVSAEALLKAGAQRDLKNKSGQTAADLADPKTDAKILKILKAK